MAQTYTVSVFFPNDSSDCKWSHRSAGRLFQIIAPVTAKFLLPSVVLVPVTARHRHRLDRKQPEVMIAERRFLQDTSTSSHQNTQVTVQWTGYQLMVR